jgi:hypothetical protein
MKVLLLIVIIGFLPGQTMKVTVSEDKQGHPLTPETCETLGDNLTEVLNSETGKLRAAKIKGIFMMCVAKPLGIPA